MRVLFGTFLGTFYGNKGYLWSLLEEHSVDKQPNISVLKEYGQKIDIKKGFKNVHVKIIRNKPHISAIIYHFFPPF